MTREHIRSLGAQLMIVAAVCGGIYAMVAEPLHSRMHEAEAELASFVSEHNGAAATLANLPEIVEAHNQTQQEAAQYLDRSRPACDESEMFAEIMDLSKRVGVVVEQIMPVNTGNAQQVQEDNNEKQRPGDVNVRYALSGSGSYEAVARFLSGLQGEWGYCTIRNCRVTPNFAHKGEAVVQFSLVIELFGFDATPMMVEASAEEVAP